MDYKPNSHKSKAEQAEKNVQKVVRGTVKTRKKSATSKFADVFISEDASNVKSYVIMDVLIPAIKKAVSDIVTDGIDMILYGGTGHSKRTGNSNKIQYRNFYDKRDDRRAHNDNRTLTGYSYDDIILDTRGEAEEVLTRMDELLDTYGVVAVADLYDLVGVTGSYTDNKWGWMNLRTAEAVRVRDGYKLKLPKAIPIE